ncbi:Cupredoxin [Chytriomyces sp. MP71]|nr:Cupredoxin [Chytriomyces sp. MP71]
MLSPCTALYVVLVAVLSVYSSHARAAPKTFTLNLAYSLQSPDGFQMNMMVANNVLEYPIVVNAGDDVEVTVINNLNVSTSMHWHGLFQKGTPWMDGAAMVSQCPILPGATRVYKFNVGSNVGTFWWHAHYQSQYINGLRGPFIINDPKDPYLRSYDEDLTLTLTDFYHNSSEWLLKNVYFTADNVDALEPLPESGLIGGVGQYNCSVTQANNPNCKNDNPLKTVTIVPGKRYRIRLINMAAHARFIFSIDGHNLTVIESDGVYTVPTVTNQIVIHSAQRYSFILTANAKTTNYWIRAMITDVWYGVSTGLNGLNMDTRGILNYQGAATTVVPTTQPDNYNNTLNLYTLGELNGLTSSDLPASPLDYYLQLYFNFQYGPPFYNSSTGSISIDSNDIQNFHGSQYVMQKEGRESPLLPLLLQNNSVQLPSTVNAITVKNNEWVYFSIQNADSMEHPFHLHGHTMVILGYGNLKHQNPPVNATYARRDTIQVPPCVGGKGGGDSGCIKGFVNVAIKFDNPGVWPFHCHIEWHMTAGLQMTFVNGGDATNALPTALGADALAMFDSCPNPFAPASSSSVSPSVTRTSVVRSSSTTAKSSTAASTIKSTTTTTTKKITTINTSSKRTSTSTTKNRVTTTSKSNTTTATAKKTTSVHGGSPSGYCDTYGAEVCYRGDLYLCYYWTGFSLSWDVWYTGC